MKNFFVSTAIAAALFGPICIQRGTVWDVMPYFGVTKQVLVKLAPGDWAIGETQRSFRKGEPVLVEGCINAEGVAYHATVVKLR